MQSSDRTRLHKQCDTRLWLLSRTSAIFGWIMTVCSFNLGKYDSISIVLDGTWAEWDTRFHLKHNHSCGIVALVFAWERNKY